MYACLVCGSGCRAKEFCAREMMFGTREAFVYYECARCCSVQIANAPSPDALARYYPSDYYSYLKSASKDVTPSSESVAGFILDRLKIWRDLHALGISHPIGSLLKRYRPALPIFRCLAAARIRISDQILDVGCGSQAELLNKLAKVGFKGLVGCDPYIECTRVSIKGVRLFKRSLEEMDGTFDIVMFHHSFEHLPNPQEALEKVRTLLRPGGRCVIRIPTTSSEAYEVYGPNWVQLDPPRHLVLLSRDGMKILASKCGFIVERVIDDSTRFQFIASELYLRDVPLVAQRESEIFCADAIADYDKRANILNQISRGDQAAFVLRVL